MRILVVSHLFAPANAIGAVRVSKFARFLLEQGHDVKVLAAINTALPQDLPVELPTGRVEYVDERRRRSLLRSSLGGYEKAYRSGGVRMAPLVRWLYKMYRAAFHFPDAQARWCSPAIAAGERLIAGWRPDVIFASALPVSSLVVASTLAQRHGIRYVAELRDLWVDSQYYEMPFWRRWIDQRMERRCLGGASALVTVSEPLADVLRRKYDKPVIVALNGFEPNDFPPPTLPESRPQDLVTIVYTGLVYPNRQRDPSPLFEALRLLGPEGRQFRVEFYGRLLSEVLIMAREHKVEDLIRVHPAVPYRQALEIQASADLLLLLLWDSPLERGVFTGKLFEYLGARRPILMLGPTDGVAADLIRARGAGRVCNMASEIAAHLREFLSEKRRLGFIPPLPADIGVGLTRTEQFRQLAIALTGPTLAVKSRSRVLVVCGGLEIGGTERHLLQVLPRIDRSRFRVIVLALRPGGSLEKDFRAAGIDVMGPPRSPARVLELALAAIYLPIYLRAVRPDVIHFFLPRAYLIGGWLASLLGYRSLIMSRRSQNTYRHRHSLAWAAERKLHRRMTRLVGNSAAVVRELVQECGGRQRVDLVYNGIDLALAEAVSRSEARRRLGVDEDTLVLICVANLIPYKGHADLLQAVDALRRQTRQRFVVYCVGRDDGALAGLQKTAMQAGVGDLLHWPGTQQDIWPWWAAADIGILCSHEEGFPNVILEAMAAGLPMVATDAGGSPEAVVDGVTGIVVPTRNPRRLAEALVRLMEDADLRQVMGRAGKARVHESFGIDRCVAAYESMYAECARVA